MGRDEWIFAAKLAAMAMVAVSVWLRSRPAVRIGFDDDSNGGGGAMRTRYRPGDKRVLKLALTDAGGNPTDYTSAPVVWGSSAASVVQVIPAPDGLSAVLNFLKPGSADVSALSDPMAVKQTFTVGGPAASIGFVDDDAPDPAPAAVPTPNPPPGPP